MNYTEATAQRDSLEAAYKAVSGLFNEIPGVGSGPCGLTPDAVKFSPEFRAAKATYQKAFDNLRAFNSYYVKVFKKQIAADREKRAAGAALSNADRLRDLISDPTITIMEKP